MPLRRLFDPVDTSITYLLFSRYGGEAAAVDPMLSQATLVLSILAERRATLRYVLRTHTHMEDTHSLPCGSLCARAGARLVAADASLGGLVAEDQLCLPFGDGELRVIATPGHTPDSVCYLWQDRLFCGDALHIGGCAEPAAQTDAGALYDSVMERLFGLPAETLVYPGHDAQGRSVSSIGEERTTNPAFACETRAVFIARMMQQAASDGLRGGLISHVSGKW